MGTTSVYLLMVKLAAERFVSVFRFILKYADDNSQQSFTMEGGSVS